jgi:hypothetical protein
MADEADSDPEAATGAERVVPVFCCPTRQTNDNEAPSKGSFPDKTLGTFHVDLYLKRLECITHADSGEVGTVNRVTGGHAPRHATHPCTPRVSTRPPGHAGPWSYRSNASARHEPGTRHASGSSARRRLRYLSSRLLNRCSARAASAAVPHSLSQSTAAATASPSQLVLLSVPLVPLATRATRAGHDAKQVRARCGLAHEQMVSRWQGQHRELQIRALPRS